MRLAGIWRYPVKSLAGESIDEALLRSQGIPGDRGVIVQGPEGVRTSRRHFGLLGLKATLDPQGRALIDGHLWSSAAARSLVKQAAGDDAWLELSGDETPFDVLPLLVATDGAVAEFGRDIRRLRPNLFISGVDGMSERAWPGAQLQIGSDGAIVRLDSLRGRCPMTTVDPDTLERDPEVLRDIGRRFGGKLALNAEIIHEGRIRVGDAVKMNAYV